jgi:hypothetical protein
MNPYRRILLLTIILLLGISGSSIRPVLAQSSLKLKPGKYAGVFNLDARMLASHQLSVESVTTKWDVNNDLYIKSTLNIAVTAPDQGRVDLDLDTPILYELGSLSVSGPVNCTISAYIDSDATVVFLAPLNNNFDPQKSSFTSSLTVSDLTDQNYNDVKTGSLPACSQQISKTTMTESLQKFIALFSHLELNVLYARDGRMGGEVNIPDWEKTIPLPEGGQVERTISGVWQAYLIPTKSRGWKK